MSEVASPLEYYASPGPLTDPQAYAELLDGLPTDVAALCRVVQGVMVHVFWAERYGLTLSEERKQEVQLRSVAAQLARLRELDDRPLTVARPPETRLVGNCRDHSTLLCAILRRQGVPARARCGFGTYFIPGHYEDHWVCEYWSADRRRWVMVDAQLDPLQREVLQIQFDTTDLPPGQFVLAGRAWQMCRAGEADPDTFGIFEWHGLGFIRGNLLRDLAALNKVETLPWDSWGLIRADDSDLSADDLALLDRVAALPLADDAFAAVRAIYEGDDRLRLASIADLASAVE